jgi:hypothetical protein
MLSGERGARERLDLGAASGHGGMTRSHHAAPAPCAGPRTNVEDGRGEIDFVKVAYTTELGMRARLRGAR